MQFINIHKRDSTQVESRAKLASRSRIWPLEQQCCSLISCEEGSCRTQCTKSYQEVVSYSKGNIDLAQLKTKAEEHKDK